jgi:hypothetical protein
MLYRSLGQVATACLPGCLQDLGVARRDIRRRDGVQHLPHHETGPVCILPPQATQVGHGCLPPVRGARKSLAAKARMEPCSSLHAPGGYHWGQAEKAFQTSLPSGLLPRSPQASASLRRHIPSVPVAALAPAPGAWPIAPGIDDGMRRSPARQPREAGHDAPVQRRVTMRLGRRRLGPRTGWNDGRNLCCWRCGRDGRGGRSGRRAALEGGMTCHAA